MFFKVIGDDLASILARDPAARSRLEVALCYPGFQAVLLYRLAHRAWRRDWVLLARMISQTARFLTGVEIHPGATIGRRLFIDHGMGVVIGETAEVGDDVTLYQGVTLGGTSLDRGKKRHPTLGQGVIVGAGAQVLGPIHVADGARVGANAVVVRDVAAGASVVGVPAKAVEPRVAPPTPDFCAYGLAGGVAEADIPDANARAVAALLDRVMALETRIAELEGESDGEPAIKMTSSRKPRRAASPPS
jgi:serine O-acetyltransferase